MLKALLGLPAVREAVRVASGTICVMVCYYRCCCCEIMVSSKENRHALPTECFGHFLVFFFSDMGHNLKKVTSYLIVNSISIFCSDLNIVNSNSLL